MSNFQESNHHKVLFVSWRCFWVKILSAPFHGASLVNFPPILTRWFKYFMWPCSVVRNTADRNYISRSQAIFTSDLHSSWQIKSILIRLAAIVQEWDLSWTSSVPMSALTLFKNSVCKMAHNWHELIMIMSWCKFLKIRYYKNIPLTLC